MDDESQEIAAINLKIQKMDDGVYLMTSDDVPGLVLSQFDWNRMFLDAPEIIRDLLRLNCGVNW